jgi:hypothetical protein
MPHAAGQALLRARVGQRPPRPAASPASLQDHRLAVPSQIVQHEQSHSTCGVFVDDTGAMFETFAAGLRARYGKLPVSGFPRITRPRPLKNAGGVSGFSLIDPAGNWIRFFQDGAPDPVGESSPLREGLLNAIVLADSKGDPVQAAKILLGALRRADPSDPAVSEARDFLAELDERTCRRKVPNPAGAATSPTTSQIPTRPADSDPAYTLDLS